MGWHRHTLVGGRRPHLIPLKLRVTVQQDLIWRNGIPCREISKPPRHSDLVALKYPGITLDRLHERAGFPLLGSAALPEAATAQPRPQIVDSLGTRGKIVGRKVIGIHGQVGLDPLQTRDHARKRAHMLAEACNRVPKAKQRDTRRSSSAACRRHQSQPASARGGGRAAPYGRMPDIAAGRNIVPRNGRAQQVEADDVIAQVRTKIGSDRFCDLDAAS